MSITLKAMRVNRGLSQKQAAFQIGVSTVTISNWENGKTTPSAKQLMKMCDVYACQAEDIFLPDDFTSCEQE